MFKSALSWFHRISPLHALFGILIFYVPIQCHYKQFFKKLFDSPEHLEKLLGFYITDLVMIAMLFILLRKWRSLIFEHLPLLSFLAISLFSILQSESGASICAYALWSHMAMPALVGMGLAQYLDRKKILRIFCWMMLVAALFQCAVAIAQYLYQHPLGLKHLGEVRYSAFFIMQDQTRWIFDKLFSTFAPSKMILRSLGTLPHPNILGGFIGVALIATSWLFLEIKKGRSWLGAALFLQIFVLFLTYSRAALFGFAGAILIFFGLAKGLYHLRALSLVVVCSILLSVVILHDQLLNRGGIINYNEFAHHSDQPRLSYQNMALEMGKQNLWLGVGLNNYSLYAEQFAPKQEPGFLIQTVHSIYFLIFAETGLLGLCSFMLFAALLIWRNLRQGITRESAPLLAIWLFLLAVGLCDHYLLTWQQGRILLFISAGLLAGQRISYSIPKSTKTKEQEGSALPTFLQ